MTYPAKFKHLFELTVDDVERPDYLWLTYAVCASSKEACGWAGWIVEGVFKKTRERHVNSSGDKLLPAADYGQTCPQCGKQLFRTSASLRFDRARNQTDMHAGVPTAPLTYDDE